MEIHHLIPACRGLMNTRTGEGGGEGGREEGEGRKGNRRGESAHNVAQLAPSFLPSLPPSLPIFRRALRCGGAAAFHSRAAG